MSTYLDKSWAHDRMLNYTRTSLPTRHTTLLRRWINVNDVDSTSQQPVVVYIPRHILGPWPNVRLDNDFTNGLSPSALSHLSGRYARGSSNNDGSLPIPYRLAWTWVWNKTYRMDCFILYSKLVHDSVDKKSQQYTRQYTSTPSSTV